MAMRSITFKMKLSSSSVFVFLTLSAFLTISPLHVAFAQNRQLSLADILIALRSKKAAPDEKNRLLTEAVKDRGITFSLTPEIEKELGTTGAARYLLDAIRQKMSAVSEPAAGQPKPQVTQIAAVIPKPTPTPLDYA